MNTASRRLVRSMLPSPDPNNDNKSSSDNGFDGKKATTPTQLILLAQSSMPHPQPVCRAYLTDSPSEATPLPSTSFSGRSRIPRNIKDVVSTMTAITCVCTVNDAKVAVMVPRHLVEVSLGKKHYCQHYDSIPMCSTTSGDDAAGDKASYYYVCERYLAGNCSDPSTCLNLHVDPAYLKRYLENVGTPLCCGHHNCVFSQDLQEECEHLRKQLYYLKVGSHTYRLDPIRVAYTIGLESVVPSSDGIVRLDLGLHLCREHLSSECTEGTHCGRVHICRETLTNLTL